MQRFLLTATVLWSGLLPGCSPESEKPGGPYPLRDETVHKMSDEPLKKMHDEPRKKLTDEPRKKLTDEPVKKLRPEQAKAGIVIEKVGGKVVGAKPAHGDVKVVNDIPPETAADYRKAFGEAPRRFLFSLKDLQFYTYAHGGIRTVVARTD